MNYVGINTRFGHLGDLYDSGTDNFINTMGHGAFYNSTYGCWVVGCDINKTGHRTKYGRKVKFIGTAFNKPEADKMFERACRMYGVPKEKI